MGGLESIGLIAVLGVVLVAPFAHKRVEHNLEIFLLIMGALAVSVAWRWNAHLVTESLREPMTKGIVPAVFVAGVAFHYGKERFRHMLGRLTLAAPLPVLAFFLVAILGLVSSVITAIVASLLLVEALEALPLQRKERIQMAVLSCFSIGLGAALTPLGEPLATIAIGKLQGEPYHAGFGFMINALGLYIFPGILAFALLAGLIAARSKRGPRETLPDNLGAESSLREVVVRSVKVYAFVAALILLGAGFELLIDRYLVRVSAEPLFWANISSAVLDNATLTAAEIGPNLNMDQIVGALVGLLVAGGMLIPGNIPNIISANKLKITSKEWAVVGVPVGLVAMSVYFAWLYLLS